MPVKYRELDEIILQAQVDFEKMLEEFEIYMMGDRLEAELGDLEVEDGEEDQIYGEEGRYGAEIGGQVQNIGLPPAQSQPWG